MLPLPLMASTWPSSHSPEYVEGEGCHGDPPPACLYSLVHAGVRSSSADLVGGKEAVDTHTGEEWENGREMDERGVRK